MKKTHKQTVSEGSATREPAANEFANGNSARHTVGGDGAENGIVRLVRKAVEFPILFYQKYISPAKRYHPCKYYPSCSQYALLAVRTHGVLLGLPMALWRILRCNPFSRGGVDPVPERGFVRAAFRQRFRQIAPPSVGTAQNGAKEHSESEK